MTGTGAAESCRVSLLVPHPRRTAVLVADDGSSLQGVTGAAGPRLPTLRMPGAEPRLSEILARVDVVDTDTTAVLRQVVLAVGDPDPGGPRADGAGALVVEFDAGVLEPTPGWVWQDLDEEVLARLEPEECRGAVASWARERVEGWSPRRPAWSRPGWFARASAWMVEQMAAAGRPAVGPPRQHQLWGLSVVLRAPSAEGEVFFKCSVDLFRREAAITRSLADRMPTLVPEVMAADGALGWVLMRDLGAAELGDQDESMWHEGLVVQAAIQQLWLGRAEELVGLGLPVRALADLAAQVEELTDDDVLLARMSPELRARWRATGPLLASSCRRLDEIGPGPTLVHGDLHPWNVVLGADGARVFDWTDAAVSHPFVDLATYVFRSRDPAVRRRLVDAYLAAWSTEGSTEGSAELSAELSAESLREAAELGLVVGALYQVQTYRALLPALMGDGVDDGMDGADLDWIDRSLTRHRLGLESPR